MSLVNYEGDSSEDENESSTSIVVVRRNLPTTTTTSDENLQSSSSFLANLPKPQELSSTENQTAVLEFPEDELEDIVRAENKTYARELPEVPKPIKRKRDGPVKIFLPTIEQDSDDEDKPKRRTTTTKRNCALLNALPAPVYDEDRPIAPLVEVKTPAANAPQVSSTGLFIPYALNKKKGTKVSATSAEPMKNANSDDDDDDDDDDQTDFLGLNKSDQIQATNVDVESVLRETFLKARTATAPPAPIVEVPVYPEVPVDFDDADQSEQQTSSIDDDEELLRFLPKSERYKEIKHVHIDSMMGESARLQLLKNATEEREAMVAQAAIVVPKGETRKRAQITYLIAKAQSDDLRLKNMWSEQKLTKRQTQAKYGF